MTKQDVLKVVQSLPEDVSFDEVIEELKFRAFVEKRVSDLDKGDTVSHEEALVRLHKWQSE
ncbi:MAG: hypothetical protein WC423_20545 [Vulcanimicrobiota bacterium]